MGGARWIGFAAGLLLVARIGSSLLRTLVVPRGFTSKLANRVEGVVRWFFLAIVRPFSSFRTKDRLLAFQAPVTLIALIVVWLANLFVGFALMLWPFTHSITNAFVQSGSSLFTLGSVGPGGAGATTIHFIAAATGLIVVALQIAYLPTLYSAFNRRETAVTTLQSRAGVPAWGPEILARLQAVGLIDNLKVFYVDWEKWAADLAETHSTYPILISFRSPHPLRSWVLALLAVLDSAALYNALCPKASPSEARLCLRMGFTAFRDIATVVEIPFDPDPLPTQPISLTFEEYMLGIERMLKVGFPMERTPEEAWSHFRGWRVNYEQIAYQLADYTVAAPSLWSGPRPTVPGKVILPLRPVDRRPDAPSTIEEPRVDTDWRP